MIGVVKGGRNEGDYNIGDFISYGKLGFKYPALDTIDLVGTEIGRNAAFDSYGNCYIIKNITCYVYKPNGTSTVLPVSNIYDLWIEGEYLYLARWADTTDGGIYKFNTSNQTQVFYKSISQGIRSICAKNGFIYAGGYYDLLMFNSLGTQVASYNLSATSMTNYNGSMAMDANYIYVQVANIQNTVHYIYKFDFNLIRDTSFYPYTGGGANDARNGNQMVVSEGYIYHRAGKFSISSNTAIYNYTPKSGLCLGENSEILIIQDSGYIGKLNKSTGGNIYLNNTNTSPEFAVIAYDPPNKRFLVGGRYTTKNMFEELKIKE